MSTPAVSAFIRQLNKEKGEDYCVGAILLTASHNPGGPKEDFGIKFNSKNGGPAVESLTNRIYEESKIIATYRILEKEDEIINLQIKESHNFGKIEGFDFDYQVRIVDPCDHYIALLQTLFDFN